MVAALAWATVQSGAPTLKRAKRRTLMFSPSLATLVAMSWRDGLRLLLDEGLVEQADLFVELGHLAFEHLLDDVGGLAGGGGLGAVDVLLALEVGFGDVFAADEARVDGGDVHGDVAEQLLEVVGAGDEVGLAVELEEHADLAAGVDVGSDGAFVGGAARPSWRPRPCRACAGRRRRSSMSPLASCRALRQSPMGAPDFSRSSLTSFASIFTAVSVIDGVP